MSSVSPVKFRTASFTEEPPIPKPIQKLIDQKTITFSTDCESFDRIEVADSDQGDFGELGMIAYLGIRLAGENCNVYAFSSDHNLQGVAWEFRVNSRKFLGTMVEVELGELLPRPHSRISPSYFN